MTIKVLVLKSGEDVIADIQEMYETQVLNDGKETDQTTGSDEQSDATDSD